jgi:hypothetical protein
MNPTNHLGVLYNDAVNGAQNSYFGANTTWTNTLSYDKKLEIIKLVNWELLQNQVNNYVSGSRNNLLFGEDPKYAFTNNTSAVTINDVSVNGADWAAGGGGIQSFFARAQYDYKEKYLLAATMRVDGSSILLQKIDGVFPSLSAGWVITKEDFMSSTTSNFAKLRASWGQNGNQY